MQHGVTLVELLIGMAILAMLVMQALPSFNSWLQNLQIRNAAEAILNGLQVAKAHALKTNIVTEFVLTKGQPVPANTGAAASASGTNWIVRTYQSSGNYTEEDFVQGRPGDEGSKNATVAAGQSSFVFSPLGRLVNPPSEDVHIDVNNGMTYENRRSMRVIISPGGQIVMCDPNKTDASNPQFCPA
jgi:type IV fimbrial biogenesis protein FimT